MRRVFLHVGTPKSGTSYLQDKLARNRDRVLAQGLDYLPTRSDDHFEAALDLLGIRWAGAEKAAKGEWPALVTQAHRSTEDVLISHEILAAATPDRVREAMRAFSRDEVHVVLTARDLGRQIPAEWQERVKHRGRRPYADFLAALQRNHRRTDWRMWFWRVQEVPTILTTWGTGLTPDRIHLVTVPHSAHDGDGLWERFTTTLGLDARARYEQSETTNASIGGAETTMLRRLNVALAERQVPRETYVEWVRASIVPEVLAARRGRRTTVPAALRPWVDEVTAEWREWVEQSRVHVVGDLDDLRPRWPEDTQEWFDPDAADPEDVAEAAISALAHVLDELREEAAPRPVERIFRRLRP